MRSKLGTKGIALMGVLMAMQLILTRFLVIETLFVRIGFGFIPTMVMALVFGPWLTGIGSALSDFIGISLFPRGGGGFFPGFTLSAFLSAAIYGFFFYKKPLTWRRVIIANLLVTVIVDMVLNTLWLYMLMGPGVLAQLPLRIGKALILLPLQVMIMYGLGNQGVLKKQITRFQA